MSKTSNSPSPDPSHISRRVNELRTKLQQVDPYLLSARTGSDYRPLTANEGEFSLKLFGEEIIVESPRYTLRYKSLAEEAPLPIQTLVLYYFTTADGSMLTHRWISFSELPDGRFYNQAFQGYTGHEIGLIFSSSLQNFKQAADKLGGQSIVCGIGDEAYIFHALPRVPLLLTCWEGDEDFPATFQILFDQSAPHYLPTDVCAILGSMLTRKFIRMQSKPVD